MKRRELLALSFGAVAFARTKTSFAETLGSSAATGTIALTFDDGPKPDRLPPLLDVLKKHSVRGTFFSVGQNVSAHPKLVERTRAEGHEHANHTWTHDLLDCLEANHGIDWVMKNQISNTQSAIENVIGRQSEKHFRPPFWAITETLVQRLEKEGYSVHHLGTVFDAQTSCPAKPLKRKFNRARLPAEKIDINSLDYEYAYKKTDSPEERTRKVSAVLRHVESTLRVREQAGVRKHLLTFHELFVSADVLDVTIPKWKANGYQFLTASEYRRVA